LWNSESVQTTLHRRGRCIYGRTVLDATMFRFLTSLPGRPNRIRFAAMSRLAQAAGASGRHGRAVRLKATVACGAACTGRRHGKRYERPRRVMAPANCGVAPGWPARAAGAGGGPERPALVVGTSAWNPPKSRNFSKSSGRRSSSMSPKRQHALLKVGACFKLWCALSDLSIASTPVNVRPPSLAPKMASAQLPVPRPAKEYEQRKVTPVPESTVLCGIASLASCAAGTALSAHLLASATDCLSHRWTKRRGLHTGHCDQGGGVSGLHWTGFMVILMLHVTLTRPKRNMGACEWVGMWVWMGGWLGWVG
jgi:hypothetical protein